MAESYPCPKCGHPVEHTHGAIGRPPWCFCRACGTMFNPEHTNTQPLGLADLTGPAPAEPVQEDTVTEPTETPAAEAKAPREVKHRPDPNTPFTDDDLAKLPNWAQGKVKTLNRHLTEALEVLNAQPQPEGHPAPSPADVYVVFDGPPGPEAGRFVECEDAEGRGINAGEWIERPNGWWALRIPREGNPQPAVKVQQNPVTDPEAVAWALNELEALRYDYANRLARIAELVNDGLELAGVGELDGDEDD